MTAFLHTFFKYELVPFLIHTKWRRIIVKPSCYTFSKLYVTRKYKQYNTPTTHLYNTVIFIFCLYVSLG